MFLWIGTATSADKLACQKRTDHTLILPLYYNVSISCLVLCIFYVKPYTEGTQFFNILLDLIQNKRFKSTFLVMNISVVPQFPFVIFSYNKV